MSPDASTLVSIDEQPRARRTADGVTALVGFLLLSLGVLGVDRVTPFEQAVQDLLTSQPSWLSPLAQLVYAFGLVYVIVLVGAIAANRTRGSGALRDVLVAVSGALVVGLVLGRWLSGAWPYVLPEVGLDDPEPRFPVLRLILVVAAIVAASPHLSRPVRRAGWLVVGLSGVAAVTLSFADPSDALGAVGLGMAAGGIVLLIFGSPRGYPDPAVVREAVARMGFDVVDVRVDPLQTWGMRRLTATLADGRVLAVKAYGRDASDTARVAKAWRTLWYREEGRTVSYSRLQAVEHEALVSMMAVERGVAVLPVVAAGETTSEVALFVRHGGLAALDELPADAVDDDLLAAIWREVALLQAASISHGSLSTQCVYLDNGRPFLGDLEFGSVVPTEADLAQDVVNLLFSLSLVVGPDRAVEPAIAALPQDRILGVLPYLSVPAIRRTNRSIASDPGATMKDLRASVASATGLELPKPAKLRRVTGRDILTAALLFFAVGALVPMLAGIDFDAVWSVLKDARWGAILVAFLVGESVFIPQAMGMMYAVGGSLPFWPLVTLQVAIMFIGLAVPSAAGRIAMNSSFLHKFGFGVTASITQGALDSLSGFTVEATILIIGLLATDVDFGLDLGTGDVRWGVVLLVVAVLALVVVGLLRRVQRLRERVLPELRKGWDALADIARTPSRAIGLLGSNLLTRLVWAAALWLVLEAVGAPITFGGALLVVVATNLLQGLVPVPGGIGVSETVMTGFLVTLGVDQNSAFAATIVWRMITFYLPSAAGFFATHWLERHEYL